MSFVADASIVGAWLLDDEATPETERLLDRYAAEQVRAPDVLAHEKRSIAVKAAVLVATDMKAVTGVGAP